MARRQVPFLFVSILALGALALQAPVANANDTEAAIGVGGLVFKKNAHIEMRSEDLFVSERKIKVKYRFKNTSAKAISTLVAFPFPDMKYEADEQSASPTEFKLKTIVDGKVVKPKLEQRAFLGGSEVTTELEKFDVPLDPNRAVSKIAKKSAKEKSALSKAGLVDKDLQPKWTLKATFHWKQTFPASKEISVEHQYAPIVGGTVQTGLDVSGKGGPEQRSYKRYCVDDEFLRSVKKAAGQAPPSSKFSEIQIEYVLVTGANWSGPIKKFKLTVDKGEAKNLMSFCGRGVKKISPTVFEVTKTNFVPKSDLSVLILKPIN